MNTSEVLNKAADLIEERGWDVGGGWNKTADSPLCLEGGILAAMGAGSFSSMAMTVEEFWSCPAYVAVSEYLGRDISIPKGGTLPRQPLWSWNDGLHGGPRSDVAGMTQGRQIVIETLRATALLEAAKESAAVQVPAEVVA